MQSFHDSDCLLCCTVPPSPPLVHLPGRGRSRTKTADGAQAPRQKNRVHGMLPMHPDSLAILFRNLYLMVLMVFCTILTTLSGSGA